MSTSLNNAQDAASGVRGVYLLTHPRSASNMFQTMMAKQPNYQNSGYKLFESGFSTLTGLNKGPLSERSQEEREAFYNGFRAAFDKLQDELEDARKNGKKSFMKEHAMFLLGPDQMFARVYDNDDVEPLMVYERDAPKSTHTSPTSLPDSLLLSLTPIFQIRHPILMFPSLFRAWNKAFGNVRTGDPMMVFALSLRRSRDLFDWYLNQTSDIHPQVIDADDIMNDRAAVRHICLQTGLDPDAVQYEWETREEPDPLKAIFLSTVYASNGILPGLAARGLELEVEKAKWKAEFGEEDGENLTKYVLDAMPDYEYLLSQRTYLGHTSVHQAQA